MVTLVAKSVLAAPSAAADRLTLVLLPAETSAMSQEQPAPSLRDFLQPAFLAGYAGLALVIATAATNCNSGSYFEFVPYLASIVLAGWAGAAFGRRANSHRGVLAVLLSAAGVGIAIALGGVILYYRNIQGCTS